MTKSKCIKDYRKLVRLSRSQRVKKNPVSKKASIREQLGPVFSCTDIRRLVEEQENPKHWNVYRLPSKMGTVWCAQLDPKTNSAAEVDSTVRRDASSQVEKVFALREGVEEDAEGESDDERTVKTVDDEEVESVVTKSELGTAGTASNVGSTVPSRLSST